MMADSGFLADILKDVWQNQKESIMTTLRVANVIKKSDTRATVLKDLGSVEFSKQNFEDAKDIYFTAVLSAKCGGKIYGMVLANIAACLIKLEQWEMVVTIVNMALNSAYPKTLRPKLYFRKIKAFVKMSDTVNAAKTASELQDFLKTSKISQNKKDELLKLSNQELNGPVDDNFICSDTLLPDLEENPNFPNISRKVELCNNEKYGRHFIAKDLIKQGECILIEKPYATIGVLSCANCNSNLTSGLLPCQNCTVTIYCSESCMANDEVIHKWECNLFQNECLININVKVRLAYRIFLKRIEAGYTINAKDNVHSSHDELFTKLSKPIFPQVYVMGIIYLAKQCCMILAQLAQHKQLKAWIKNKTNSTEINILSIGEDLLRFTQICCSNAVDNFNTDMYLSLSFFNHSCEPNTVQSIVRDHMVLKALHTIKPGEQIYVCYLDPKNMSKSERQGMLLMNWFFKCECKLCLSNEENVGNYKCPKCNSCDTRIRVNMLMCNSCKKSTAIPPEKVLMMEHVHINEKVLANLDDASLYGLTAVGNGIEINPKSDFGEHAYLEIVTRKLKSGDLKNIEKYLPLIRNLRWNEVFNNYYVKIYKNLLHYTKSTYFSPSRFTPKLDMSTLNDLIDHLKYLQIFWNIYNPCSEVLKNIADMEAFLTFQKQILQFQETSGWTH